jgi:prevent-host-death family protein
MQVNVLEAKTRLSELLRAVKAGEEVVISNRGTPVARLIGIEQAPKKGTGAALLAMLRDRPAPMQRRTSEEIEAYIAEERAAWD